jgi:FKBP-type peptidyl-prolyl cis-trans isomerase FkpA
MRAKAHVLMLLATLLVVACGSNPVEPDDVDDVANLEKIDVVIGTGAEATNTKRATVNYTGYLYVEASADHRGLKFDSSLDPGRSPYPFDIGAGRVIAGWDQGVPGMKVGGKRTLIIPSRLGYGSRGQGSIPPNSALVFDIELLSLQ